MRENRIIKFRVVNGNIICAYEQLSRFGWTHMLVNNETTYAGTFDEGEFGHSSALTRNQFTGLHDKNGKEIFEGDALITEDKSLAERHQTMFVKWSGAGFVIYNPNCCLSCKEGDGCIGPIDEWPKETFEIIGNIYETPELLKQ